MPELPEVKTTVDSLLKEIVNFSIVNVWTDTPQRVKGSLSNIKNKKIKNLRREGKNIIISLSQDIEILIHQKISGHVLLGHWNLMNNKWVSNKKELQEKINTYIHFVFSLNDGRMIAISDPRKFAKVEIWEKNDLEKKLKNDLGPDALGIDKKSFESLFLKKNGNIKRALMDQSFIAGIGNIYSDEILWDSKISPFKKIIELKNEDIKNIFDSMKKILKFSIKHKGDSMSDYRLIDGTKGGFQKFHKVYKKEGNYCERNDKGIIKREKFGGRSVRFCPVCQK